MPTILSQQAARRARSLPFCYLCGTPITDDEREGALVNRDHIPPQNLFPRGHRNWPLVLDTHERCNKAQSNDDEIIGGLLQSGERVAGGPAEALRLIPTRYQIDGSPHLHGLFDAPKVEAMVWRWVRGFHAALYGEFLPEGTPHRTLLPFPMSSEIDGQQQLLCVDDIMKEAILLLKGNRSVDHLDRIECDNKQCQFHCVWHQSIDGRWEAVFGLKVCDWGWAKSGPAPLRRGCVGFYVPISKPAAATTASTGLMPFVNGDPLDPFGH